MPRGLRADVSCGQLQNLQSSSRYSRWAIPGRRIARKASLGSDTDAINALHQQLVSTYKITDWDPISSFLGINMSYKDGTLEMDVINKIKDLFKQHGIINSTHNIPGRDTPLDDDYSRISLEPGKIPYSELDDHLDKNFASIVGALIYISITARPDLAFTIGKLSRGMHQPNPRHIAMLKHTLGYLRRTQDYKMVYKRTNNAVEALFRDLGQRDIALATLSGSDGQNIDPLGGFSDANFANKSDEQTKSISGYCFISSAASSPGDQSCKPSPPLLRSNLNSLLSLSLAMKLSGFANSSPSLTSRSGRTSTCAMSRRSPTKSIRHPSSTSIDTATTFRLIPNLTALSHLLPLLLTTNRSSSP